MNKIYCSNCGQHVNSQGNYCSYCGIPLHGKDALAYHANDDNVVPSGKKPSIKPNKDVIKRSKLGFMAVVAFSLNYIFSTSILLPFLIGLAILEPTWGTIAILVFFFMIFIIAFLNYLYFWYEVTEDGLNMKYGIIFQKHITVPYSGIQNVNIERSLADMILGVARVSIETAGSPSQNPINAIGGYKAKSEAYIPGLSLAKAKVLHDLLVDGKLDEVQQKD